MAIQYQKLFTPVSIGNCTIKNRFAMAPMGPLGLADAEGGFNQRGIDYYTERARGGTGLIITGVTFVDNEVEEHGMPNCPCPTHNPVHFIRTAREMTERIHAYQAKIFLQMSGGFGRVTIPTNLGEYPPVAPSPIPHRWLDKTCRELTKEEIRTIVEQFGKGAFNAKRAGFDGVQIHAVHEGYLIDQFAIALFNQRTDEYGGSLENRLRFAREIVEEIKRTCGPDFPVTLRYSPKSFIKDFRDGALPGEEFEEKGRDLEEGVEAAKLLVEYGYDALDTDVGSYDSWWWSHPPMYQEKGLYRPFARLMKETVDVPIICAGRMDDPDMALEAVEQGVTDMVSLGRPLLADPEYVNKLRSGRRGEIRPCISCHEGCMGRIQEFSMLNCAVNPQACRERVTALTPAAPVKKVLIVGGGVAGCEAARVLAMRGHKPELFEKGKSLGGNLLPGGAPDFKEDDIALANWYARMLDKLNVPVHLEHEVTAEQVKQSDADAVIIATGSTPKLFTLGNDEHVYSAAQVLTGEKDAGDTAVVIGGGLVGCEIAFGYVKEGKQVTIVEALDEILNLNNVPGMNKSMLLDAFEHYGTKIYTGTKLKAVRDEGAVVELPDGTEKTIEADTVIMSIGYRPLPSLAGELTNCDAEIIEIGDGRKVGNVLTCIKDAYEAVKNL